jgi:hypothetical protein
LLKLVAKAEWMDATEMLGPGVYVLWWQGRVKKLAWTKSMMTRVVAHRNLCGERVAHWQPIQGIRFDGVSLWPCPEHQSHEVIERLKSELGYEAAAAA